MSYRHDHRGPFRLWLAVIAVLVMLAAALLARSAEPPTSAIEGRASTARGGGAIRGRGVKRMLATADRFGSCRCDDKLLRGSDAQRRRLRRDLEPRDGDDSLGVRLHLTSGRAERPGHRRDSVASVSSEPPLDTLSRGRTLSGWLYPWCRPPACRRQRS